MFGTGEDRSNWRNWQRGLELPSETKNGPSLTPGRDEIVLDARLLDAVLFDMDGVVTRTATVHAVAWKQAFDAFLKSRLAAPDASFEPFDADADYRLYVDGKPRLNGVIDFLASRGITLPLGNPSDPPEDETVWGLANHKERLFELLLTSRGVDVFHTTVDFIASLRQAGLKTGIFSASKHAHEVLSAANVLSLVDAKVDGVDAERLALQGKPHPATLLELARRLGVEPRRCAVVEDAIAGVQAGRGGGFALVIGVNRSDEQGVLLRNGADMEVKDLGELTIGPVG
jgi:alpha,alpha-trehalase